jgi:hypothetical protein
MITSHLSWPECSRDSTLIAYIILILTVGAHLSDSIILKPLEVQTIAEGTSEIHRVPRQLKLSIRHRQVKCLLLLCQSYLASLPWVILFIAIAAK